MDLSVTYIYNQAKALFKRYGLALCLVLLVTSLITGIITFLALDKNILDAVTEFYEGDPEAALRIFRSYFSNIMWVMSAVFIISLFFNALTTVYVLRTTCDGGKVGLQHFRLPAVKFLKYAGVNIITSFAITFGLFMFVIPGLYIMLRLFFAPFYVVDKDDASIGDALSWSWRTSAPCQLDLFTLGLVSVLAVGGIELVGGLLPFGLGNILTILAQAFVLFAQVATYTTLRGVEKRGLWINQPGNNGEQ